MRFCETFRVIAAVTQLYTGRMERDTAFRWLLSPLPRAQNMPRERGAHDVCRKKTAATNMLAHKSVNCAFHVGTVRLERTLLVDRRNGILRVFAEVQVEMRAQRDCEDWTNDVMMLCACATGSSGERRLHSVCPIVEL